MSPRSSRREFLGATACGGTCLLLGLSARHSRSERDAPQGKHHDFDKLAYCCSACSPEQCPLLNASLRNDLEYKKKEAEKWREKYGREFEPAEVFCSGCKAEPAKLGANVKACAVRACVVGKGLVSCAHCRDLATCPQPLWVNYPKFREHVLNIQKDVLGKAAAPPTGGRQGRSSATRWA